MFAPLKAFEPQDHLLRLVLCTLDLIRRRPIPHLYLILVSGLFDNFLNSLGLANAIDFVDLGNFNRVYKLALLFLKVLQRTIGKVTVAMTDLFAVENTGKSFKQVREGALLGFPLHASRLSNTFYSLFGLGTQASWRTVCESLLILILLL